MNLARMFEFAAERYPEWEAIVDGDRRMNYADWDARINRLAGSLHELGVRAGDRVLILLKNREEHATAYWALQKLRAVSTPINFRSSAGELAYCANDAGVVALLFEEASREAVLTARDDLQTCRHLIFVGDALPGGCLRFEELIRSGSPDPVGVDVDDREPCLMLYTSGTTGRPKGVPRSHRAEYAAAMAHCVQNRYQPGERTLGVMPLYHTMGIRSLLSMAFLNGLLVAMPDFDPDRALDLIERERISCLYLVPTIYHDILNRPDFSRRDCSSVRKLGFAGASMTSNLTRRCAEAFQPEVFINHYGSTEVYTMTICDRVAEKPGCAGRPGIHARMRVVRADPEGRVGPDEVLPRGEVGELIASLDSDEAFSGYWNRPDADAKAIRDGWYFTGDLGYQDEEGDFYVTGRVDDMIISGGENIQPLEVEDVLSRHPGVAEVAVAGQPDERWGELVTAFVVPRRDDLTEEELDRHCRESSDLANFKRPRRYVFVRSIPKSATGKILRRKLRAGEYEAR